MKKTEHRLSVCAASGVELRCRTKTADKMSAGRTGNMPVFHSLRAVFAILALAVPMHTLSAQNDPASEPAVLAVAKVLPAVVNIDTGRDVRPAGPAPV